MSIEKIKKLLSEQLNVSINKIEDNSRIVEDLGADSLDVVEMLMTLEDEFGIQISDEEAASLKTVKDIVNYMEQK